MSFPPQELYLSRDCGESEEEGILESGSNSILPMSWVVKATHTVVEEM